MAHTVRDVDSSMVARIVATRANNPLSTFSVTFDDPAFDESAFQMRMSRFLGARHEVVQTTHADIARVFPEVILAHRNSDHAHRASSHVPAFQAGPGFRIQGCPDGRRPEEVLGGYDVFKEAAIRRFWARSPESARGEALEQGLCQSSRSHNCG
jgi:asparagine synthase (glutamine-hydrolysing)